MNRLVAITTSSRCPSLGLCSGANAELPTEVVEYLFAMARRINAAYAALNVEQKKQAARAEPVFMSAGR